VSAMQKKRRKHGEKLEDSKAAQLGSRGKDAPRRTQKSGKYDKQWRAIAAWRRWLQGNGEPPGDVVGRDMFQLRKLEDLWQACERAGTYPPVMQREEFDKLNIAPLRLMFFYISFGLYPPPELLLALHAIFSEYLERGGPLELETAFFGRSVPRAGNYAARVASTNRKFALAFETQVIAAVKGKDLAAAADDVIRSRGALGKGNKPMDAETVKKIIREMNGRTRARE